MVEALVEGRRGLARWSSTSTSTSGSAGRSGLKPEDLRIVLDYVIARIGFQYDRRNFWDLTRYFLPFQMIPAGAARGRAPFRQRRDTETICSSLLAEAFALSGSRSCPCPYARSRARRCERLRQQILGRPTRRARSGLLRARHPTLCVPRDFDLSPYFDIVKFNARESSPSTTGGWSGRGALGDVGALALRRR